MLHREKITRILTQARQIDANCEMFGADHHQYRLNPPVPESFVRDVEEKCGFTLPSDYRRFITQVGDGGAGPDYGIDPFRHFWKEGYFQEDQFAEAHRQRYRRSLTRPFAPRPMTPEDQAITQRIRSGILSSTRPKRRKRRRAAGGLPEAS